MFAEVLTQVWPILHGPFGPFTSEVAGARVVTKGTVLERADDAVPTATP